MGTTLIEERKRGADPSKLTAGEQKFVLELLANGMSNIADAVRKAFPKNRNPAQYGNSLLKRPRIKALLGKLMREDVERLELDRLEAVKQLYYALTRSIKDFTNPNGTMKSPHELPERCQSIVDSYKCKVLYTLEDGSEMQEIEYRLTPHATAREQALKHLGLFAPEVQKQLMGIDWDSLAAGGNAPVDVVEQEILKLEDRSRGNGNGESD